MLLGDLPGEAQLLGSLAVPDAAVGTISPSGEREWWVTEEGEAILAANPKLRERIEPTLAESRAGTLRTIPDSAVRARMAELRAAQRQSRKSG